MTTILHAIETSGPGGAERMLISLVEHLDRSRYQSIVLLPKEGWLSAQLRQRGFETLIRPQHGAADVAWLYRLARLIQRRRIGLMHSHEFTMNLYGAVAAAIAGIPIVSTVHGKNYYPDKWRRRAAYRAVARRGTLVAVSEDIRRFLASRVGVAESDVTTVYNGIDPAPFRPNPDARRAVRARLNLGGRPVVGTVGNLYAVKGHAYLLEAAAIVAAAVPDVMFLVAGRGMLLESLQCQARRFGIVDNVAFLGFEDDIPSLLQAMDVFALPSLSEGLPLSVLEAMSAGKPVVATDVGGNPEVIADGHTGFLVPPKDSGALAAQMLRLLGNSALRTQFGNRGRLRVEEFFALRTMVNGYQNLYRRRIGALLMDRGAPIAVASDPS